MVELVTRSCYILYNSNPFITLGVYLIFFGIFYKLIKIKKIPQIILFVVAASPAIVFAIRLILNDYFLSDDFDHFKLSSTYSYLEIIKDGILANNLWAFHRLFTAFILFKFIYSLFGADYAVFVLVNLCLHLINSYLLFKVILKLKINTFISYLLIFIFSSFYLTWISNIHELLALTFFLITFMLLINKKFTIVPIVTYFLAIYSKEITFVLPICTTLFLVTYNNYIKNIDIKNYIKNLIPYFLIFTAYLVLFVSDFIKFSSFSTNSGYDTVYRINSVIGHFAFYINDRIPIMVGTSGIIIFVSLVLCFDLIKRKLVLIPLFSSFVLLIFPVLFLSKSTPYYGYIPFVFIILIFAIVFNLFKKIPPTWLVFLSSVALVFVFKHNLMTQENCFLIQYPRIHPRNQAVINILNGTYDNSSEAKWLIENDYVKYLK